MTTPTLSPPLERFHKRNRLSVAGLRRWLIVATQSSTDPLSALERGHARWLLAIGESASELVRDMGRDPLYACRHALATSPPPTLAAWRHALELNGLTPFGDRETLRPLIAAAEARMPDGWREQQTHFDVIAQASKRPMTEVLDAVRASWHLFLALLRVAPPRLARKELGWFLKEVNGSGFGADPHKSLQSKRIAKRMAELLRQRLDVRLSAAQFDRVCPTTVEAIGDVSLLLTESTRVFVQQRGHRHAAAAARMTVEQQKAHAHELTEATIASILQLPSCVGATAAVIRRQWRAIAERLQALEWLRLGGEYWETMEAMEARLNGTIDALTDRLHLIPPAPREIQHLVRHSITAPLGLVWASLDHHARCADRFARELVERSADCRSALNTAALKAYRRNPGRVWDACGSDLARALPGSWDGVFLVKRTLQASEKYVVLDWLESSSIADRDAFERLQARWMDKYVQTRHHLESHDLTPTLLGLRSARRFRLAMQTALSMGDSYTRHRVVKKLKRLRAVQSDHGRCIADQIASEGLRAMTAGQALDLLSGLLSVERLTKVCESAADPAVSDRSAGELFRCIRSARYRGAKVGFASLMLQDDVPQGALDGIWRAAMACGEDEAIWTAHRFPRHFMTRAVRDLPLASLLARAAAAPSLARLLAPIISRADLLAALPDARIRLGKRPGLRAALELAILSDLRELPYLRQLARTSARKRKSGFRFDSCYRTYQVPKRSGGKRTISVPDASLMRLQRRLLVGAFEPIPLHDAAHGFRRGRGILSNAAAHVGRQLVVNVDIKGFFPSTSHAAVLAACLKVDGGNLSIRGAKLLADICCHRGALPTGAPTSPAIGNLVLRSADAAIATAAARFGITYTRYADDLTFSGDSECKRILPFVSRVIHECGYELDERKTQLYRKGRQQLVTSLVVNDKANLPRSDRRRLRAAVDRRCAGHTVTWQGQPMDDRSLRGRIALLHMIEPTTARKYLERLNQEANGWSKARE